MMFGGRKATTEITNDILCTPQLHTRHVYPSYVRDLLWGSEFVRVVIMLQRRLTNSWKASTFTGGIRMPYALLQWKLWVKSNENTGAVKTTACAADLTLMGPV